MSESDSELKIGQDTIFQTIVWHFKVVSGSVGDCRGWFIRLVVGFAIFVSARTGARMQLQEKIPGGSVCLAAVKGSIQNLMRYQLSYQNLEFDVSRKRT